MANQPPFNPEAFAKWLIQGLKETLQYRFKHSIAPFLSPAALKEQVIELLDSKIPNRNQLFHHALKQTFLSNGFVFDQIQQGDAIFHVIRKRFRDQGNRKLLVIPGLGDTPSSWIPPFAFAKKTLEREFDEILIIDFPGYLGFLSHTSLVPSMTLLQNVIQTIVDQHAPTTILGHSLGGWLAGKAAQILRRPLEHLILVAPSGLTPVNEREAFGEFILSMQRVPAEQVIEKLVHESHGFHRFLKQEFNFFYSKPELKRFIESVKQTEFIDENVPFRAKKVSLIWGESDVFVPSHWARHWIECYGPYIDVFMMPKVGHLPQLERPKVISSLIQTIITGTSPRNPNPAHWQKIHQARQSFMPDLLTGPLQAKALPGPVKI